MLPAQRDLLEGLKNDVAGMGAAELAELLREDPGVADRRRAVAGQLQLLQGAAADIDAMLLGGTGSGGGGGGGME